MKKRLISFLLITSTFILKFSPCLAAGGIFSVCLLEKEARKINILGISDTSVRQKTKSSNNDSRDKEIFFEQMKSLAKDKPKTFVMFDSKSAFAGEVDIHDELKQTENYYQTLSKAFMVFAHRNNYRYKKMTFLPHELYNDTELQLVNYFDLMEAENFKYMAENINLGYESTDEIDEALAKDANQRKQFFSAGGPFERYVKEFDRQLEANEQRNHWKRPKKNDFILQITEELQRLKERALRFPETYINPIITTIEIRLKQLQSYFALYSTEQNPECIAVLMNAIRSKQAFIPARNEFRNEVITCINKVIEIKRITTLLEATLKHDHILCFIEFMDVSQVADALKQNGFSERYSEGYIPRDENVVIPKKNLFNDTDLKILLRAFFCSTIPQSSIARSKITYVTEDLKNSSSTPFRDLSLSGCTVCHSIVKKADAFVTTEPGDLYCSSACASKAFIKKSPLKTLLDARLTQDNAEILKKIALLCYLQFLMLSPGTLTDNGPFYQLPHSKLVTQLNAQDENQKALKYAELFGISVKQIAGFMRLFEITKTPYVKALLEKALSLTYDELGFIETPITFDEKGVIKAVQDVQVKRITALGKFAQPKNRTFAQLYFQIMEDICTKLSIPIDHIIEIPFQNTILDLYLNAIRIPIIPEPAAVPQQTPIEREPEQPIPEVTEPQFTEVVKKTREEKMMLNIFGIFCGALPYSLTLFRLPRFYPKTQEYNELWRVWNNQDEHPEAYRVKVLFALSEELTYRGPARIITDAYGCPALEYLNMAYDQSIRERLTLNHLFTRLVDRHLQSFGIIEKVNDLIQISIGCKMIYHDQRYELGFLQYSYLRSGKLIHRCFTRYNVTNGYVSPSLRRAFYNFLIATGDEKVYTHELDTLKKLIKHDYRNQK